MSEETANRRAEAERHRQEYLAMAIDRDGDTEEEKQMWNALQRAAISPMSAAAFRHAFGQIACNPPLTTNQAMAVNGKSRRSVMRAAAELKRFLDAGLERSVTDAPVPLVIEREPSPPTSPPGVESADVAAAARHIDEASLIQAVQTVLEGWGTYKRDPIPFPLRVEVYDRDGYACVECGRGTHLTVDHCIAVTSGGATVIENLRTLCGPCNSRKGAKNVRPVS